MKRPGLEVRSRREFVERPAGEVIRERVLANLFRKDEAARLPIAVSPGAPFKAKKDLYRTLILDLEVEVETVDPASRISLCVQDETSGNAGFRLIPGSAPGAHRRESGR